MTEDNTNYGPTDDGYIQRYYSDVVASKRQRAIDSFGSQIDLTDSSVFGQFINSMSYEEAFIWQVMENLYYSRYVQFATGKALDDVVYTKGIFRKQGTKSIGTVTFTKIDTYAKRIRIPKGTIISDIDGLYPFQTTEDAEFVVNSVIQTITVPIESVNIGLIYNVNANKLNTLMIPINGILYVTNTIATYRGSNRESDEELRLRATMDIPGMVATKNSIVSSLLDIEDVLAVNITEYFVHTNGLQYQDLNEVLITSMPACSFLVFIIGASDNNKQEIIDTIESMRALGVYANAIKATEVNMNIVFSGTFNDSNINIASAIRVAVTDIVNKYGFGEVIVYSTILKAITNIPQIQTITALTVSVPEYRETMSTFSDSIDMGIATRSSQYLKVNSISINGDIFT